MALFYPDKLRSNNPGAYGIVDAMEVSGHRHAATLASLDELPDALLMGSAESRAEAVGQLWYVAEEANRGFWQLTGWTAEAGRTWERFSPGSGGGSGVTPITQAELDDILV